MKNKIVVNVIENVDSFICERPHNNSVVKKYLTTEFVENLITEFRDLIYMEYLSTCYDPRNEKELIHLASECAELCLKKMILY